MGGAKMAEEGMRVVQRAFGKYLDSPENFGVRWEESLKRNRAKYISSMEKRFHRVIAEEMQTEEGCAACSGEAVEPKLAAW